MCHYLLRSRSLGRKPGEPNQPFQATAKSGPRLEALTNEADRIVWELAFGHVPCIAGVVVQVECSENGSSPRSFGLEARLRDFVVPGGLVSGDPPPAKRTVPKSLQGLRGR